MTHLSDGTLRRLIDEPLAIDAGARSHYDSCAECRARAGGIAAEAAATAALLAAPDHTPDSALALRRVRAALPSAGRLPIRLPFGGRALRTFASAAAAILVIFALSTSGLADSFLQIFEPKRFVAIPVTEADLRALPYPYEYGTVTWSGPGRDDWSGRIFQTPDLSSARSSSGLAVAVPQRLPTDAGAVSYHVLRAARMTFTFSAAAGREAAARRGKVLPPMPASMDGSSLYVDVGPVVLATYYGTRQSGMPAVVVIEARAPIVSSNGVTVAQLRDYLLLQPGISRSLSEQIRALAEPESTLPIPVPLDHALTRSVNVNGRQGLLIGDSTGAGSVVFWRDGDVVRAVAGPLGDREVLDIANSLK